jgi:hypothetical protein
MAEAVGLAVPRGPGVLQSRSRLSRASGSLESLLRTVAAVIDLESDPAASKHCRLARRSDTQRQARRY